jgi:hypothetical protein
MFAQASKGRLEAAVHLLQWSDLMSHADVCDCPLLPGGLPLLLLQSELLAELEGELFDLRDQLAASAGEATQQQQQQHQEALSWGARLRSRVQRMRLPWQAPVESRDNSSRGACAFKFSDIFILI